MCAIIDCPTSDVGCQIFNSSIHLNFIEHPIYYSPSSLETRSFNVVQGLHRAPPMSSPSQATVARCISFASHRSLPHPTPLHLPFFCLRHPPTPSNLSTTISGAFIAVLPFHFRRTVVQRSLLLQQALEDPVSSVRDAFAEALGAVLALVMNPQAQVQPKKGQANSKNPEGSLQKHLILPFTKASGPRSKDLRIGITLSWVFFLQGIRLKYMHPDSELQNYLVQIMDMLRAESVVDAQSLAFPYQFVDLPLFS
ncbi:unnamed protein product [Lactuca virosa]|uniref:Uncharacterized protein n=1 Tax=Lactuca virosa TaxID=75947 RepID=A0AAU9LRY0_9ASTR|nr:unnamed protein product [Lactuca virosa]